MKKSIERLKLLYEELGRNIEWSTSFNIYIKVKDMSDVHLLNTIIFLSSKKLEHSKYWKFILENELSYRRKEKLKKILK